MSNSNVFCSHCQKLNDIYSPTGDAIGFSAHRLEAIKQGVCDCENQIITQTMIDAWNNEFHPDQISIEDEIFPF